MAPLRLRVPASLAELLRGLYPDLRRKVRAYRVGPEPVIELVAIGPRRTIYEETFRLLRRK